MKLECFRQLFISLISKLSDQTEPVQNMKLPTYMEATTLPSYEEAERTKLQTEVKSYSPIYLEDFITERGCHGCDCMVLVVRFTATYAISTYHH